MKVEFNLEMKVAFAMIHTIWIIGINIMSAKIVLYSVKLAFKNILMVIIFLK